MFDTCEDPSIKSSTRMKRGNGTHHKVQSYSIAPTCITNTNQIASCLISPFNHEEADARVFLHVNDMSLQNHSKEIIRMVDSDVLVLAVSAFACLKDWLEELWEDFGVVKYRNHFSVHIIFNNLEE